ncbi:MAG: AtpZ/AtpI family protein [Alphaproteobacteria bacterium]
MTISPEELDRKIKEAQAKQSQDTGPLTTPLGRAMPAGVAKALRAATDLTAGIVVGGALGYGLDKWLDTKPLFMILLFFAGFAAGVLNIYRAEMGQDYKVGFKPDTKDTTGNKRE